MTSQKKLSAEDVPELRRGLAGQRRTARAAAGSGPRPEGQPVVAMSPPRSVCEQLAVHARLEVVALERGQRAHPEEVVHAAVVLRASIVMWV
jgi:hypothetical protein